MTLELEFGRTRGKTLWERWFYSSIFFKNGGCTLLVHKITRNRTPAGRERQLYLSTAWTFPTQHEMHKAIEKHDAKVIPFDDDGMTLDQRRKAFKHYFKEESK